MFRILLLVVSFTSFGALGQAQSQSLGWSQGQGINMAGRELYATLEMVGNPDYFIIVDTPSGEAVPSYENMRVHVGTPKNLTEVRITNTETGALYLKLELSTGAALKLPLWQHLDNPKIPSSYGKRPLRVVDLTKQELADLGVDVKTLHLPEDIFDAMAKDPEAAKIDGAVGIEGRARRGFEEETIRDAVRDSKEARP